MNKQEGKLPSRNRRVRNTHILAYTVAIVISRERSFFHCLLIMVRMNLISPLFCVYVQERGGGFWARAAKVKRRKKKKIRTIPPPPLRTIAEMTKQKLRDILPKRFSPKRIFIVFAFYNFFFSFPSSSICLFPFFHHLSLFQFTALFPPHPPSMSVQQKPTLPGIQFLLNPVQGTETK